MCATALAGIEADVIGLPPLVFLAGDLVAHPKPLVRFIPSARMSNHSVPSSGPNGLSVTTTSTASPVAGSNLLYASRASLSTWWKWMVRS